MPEKGTENTITVDANIIHFYRIYLSENKIPESFGINRMEEFVSTVLEKFPIAYNEFIKIEYEQTSGSEFISRWLKERHKNGIAILVNCTPLNRGVKSCLQRDYNFNCRSRDIRYLETCKNTYFKKFLTQNTTHFFRAHRNRGAINMADYLAREEGILILTIDSSCSELIISND